MNIFFLSADPQQAAQWHCDKHVVKMLLESTQLLWTAWQLSNGAPPADAPCCRSSGSPGYRPTHKNHPCAIWARASLGNYMWLCHLAAALATEYHYRYPESSPHACEEHVVWLMENPPRLPEGSMTWPALAMPPEFKISRDPMRCYRAFYVGSKGARGLLTYTRRELPEWIS